MAIIWYLSLLHISIWLLHFASIFIKYNKIVIFWCLALLRLFTATATDEKRSFKYKCMAILLCLAFLHLSKIVVDGFVFLFVLFN